MASSNGRRAALAIALGTVAAIGLSACGTTPTGSVEGGGDSGEIIIWAADGETPETIVLDDIIAKFEEEHPDISVKIQGISFADYTQTVLTTPVEELGDLLFLDGPNVASYAWNGKIAPLDDWVSPETLANQTPAVLSQNSYNGEVYALSIINSGMGLWGNKELLEAAGVELPTSAEDAWTAEEFDEVLAQLAANDPDGKPFGIAENYGLTSEWGIYGFAPIIWSAGASVIKDGAAQGNLDSPEAVEALTKFASWREYVDPDTDGQAFQTGRVALQWMGHWNYVNYTGTLGDNLQVGPLPDFGQGAKTGTGSIAWAMGAGTKNAKIAALFLDFLMEDQNINAYSDASGSPPATLTTYTTSERYGVGGPLELLSQQLENSCPSEEELSSDCVGVTRPVTPGYPTVTLEFGKALSEIWGGADAQEALSSAARAIDREAADNDNYKD